MPVVCYRPVGSNPTVIARYSSLLYDTQLQTHVLLWWDLAAHINLIHGVPANAAHAHHNNIRNLYGSKKRNRQKDVILFTCFPRKSSKVACESSNFIFYINSFFKCSSAASIERLTGIFVHPSFLAISS